MHKFSLWETLFNFLANKFAQPDNDPTQNLVLKHNTHGITICSRKYLSQLCCPLHGLGKGDQTHIS